jgi:hypothetical protein
MKNELSTPHTSRAASSMVSVWIPAGIWPQFLFASAAPSSLASLSYALKKLVAVLAVSESVRLGRGMAAGARLAGVNYLTARSWFITFEHDGFAGIFPRRHRSGRRPKHSKTRPARSVRLPLLVELREFRMRGGRLAFRASARPIISKAARRDAHRATRALARTLPGALSRFIEPRRPGP